MNEPKDPPTGLTLRDYFAAAALPAIYAEYCAGRRADEFQSSDTWAEELAIEAYALAESMLLERGR